jgi:RHS repeat-associated protein
MSSDSISIFGIDGKQIGTYTAGAAWNNTQTQIPLSFYSTTQRVYFGPKLVATFDWQGYQHGVVQDRLESVGKYYPFGEERNSPPLANDQVKFATYTRDSATGLDYADQRYYANTFGRFMTGDPYRPSMDATNPGSLNRYAYVWNDPINSNDPEGLCVIMGQTYPDPCFKVGGSAAGLSTSMNIFLTPAIAQMWNIGPQPWQYGAQGMANTMGGMSIPRCPSLPALPAAIPSSQLQANINEAHDFYKGVLASDPEHALAALMGFFAGKFQPHGPWDYKDQYKQYTPDYDMAAFFANFNFGAVLRSFGFSYDVTQSAAGVEQIAICALSGGNPGHCGTGIPLVSWPDGDQVLDALQIKKGYDYENTKLIGCLQ